MEGLAKHIKYLHELDRKIKYKERCLCLSFFFLYSFKNRFRKKRGDCNGQTCIEIPKKQHQQSTYRILKNLRICCLSALYRFCRFRLRGNAPAEQLRPGLLHRGRGFALPCHHRPGLYEAGIPKGSSTAGDREGEEVISAQGGDWGELHL